MEGREKEGSEKFVGGGGVGAGFVVLRGGSAWALGWWAVLVP